MHSLNNNTFDAFALNVIILYIQLQILKSQLVHHLTTYKKCLCSSNKDATRNFL